jgi:hypothetical protein
MTKFSKTTLTASIGALAIAASFAVSATPAAAGWHGHGYGYGGGLAVGLLGAAIVGSAIASQPTYYATPVYCGCRHVHRRVIHRHSAFVGHRRVRIAY